MIAFNKLSALIKKQSICTLIKNPFETENKIPTLLHKLVISLNFLRQILNKSSLRQGTRATVNNNMHARESQLI